MTSHVKLFWHSGLQRIATKTWAQSCDAKGKGPQVPELPSRGREWQGRGGWGWRSWTRRSWPSLWPGSPPGRKPASFVRLRSRVQGWKQKNLSGVPEKRIGHLRYKFGFGGVDDGADDFLSSLILKLSEAFFDLIDLEVFFGSWSSATYTRRRSRIAKPKTQTQGKILRKKDLGRVMTCQQGEIIG